MFNRWCLAVVVVPTVSLADPAPLQSGSVAQPDTADAQSADPFAWADWTWLSGNARTVDSPLGNDTVTGEFRLDTSFHYSLNHPTDDTISGSSEVFRHAEIQVTQLGIGGDFHRDNVIGRLMTQFGMYATTTPRNDASVGRGQWDLSDAYRYLSEAYGGYHFDVQHGINVEAGIFLSYVGLWSFYQFDNWTYQPSFVSSNTPWYFNGARVQWFPTDRLKIEPWLVNGWQSYGRFNSAPGGGGQVMWRPRSWLSLVSNVYAGSDTLGIAHRNRVHSDNSVQVKWYENSEGAINRIASALTVDAGCEYSGGVSCFDGNAGNPSQYFLGLMAYTRAWFGHSKYAVTVGGGAIDNPGRYLVLLPPINGANAQTGSAYFTEHPGDEFKAWDTQWTFDWMPKQFFTLRFEFNYRYANVPYFSGPGGVTPPGGNAGNPGVMIPGWAPDLVKSEPRFTVAMLVKM